jgi:hypothetical protein
MVKHAPANPDRGNQLGIGPCGNANPDLRLERPDL